MSSENKYELTKEELEKVFKEDVLPDFIDKYKIQESKDLTAYFTAGIPGAGKSNIVKDISAKNPGIPVIDMDELRSYHPRYDEIMENHPKEMANHTNEAAYQWAMKLRDEVVKNRSNFIFDSSLRTASNVEHYITDKKTGVTKDGYSVKVVMIAATEHEALQGAKKRYNQQYQKDPFQARYVDVDFIKQSAQTIKESARKIEELVNKSQIKEFQIRTRDSVIIFDTSKGDKDAYKAIENYNKEQKKGEFFKQRDVNKPTKEKSKIKDKGFER